MKYIVKITGGLGNQMFQYAWARTMQSLYGGEILFDTHFYSSQNLRRMSLVHFKLNEQVKLPSGILDKFLIYSVGAYKKILDLFLPSIDFTTFKKKAQMGIYEQVPMTELSQSWLKPKRFINYFEGEWMSEKCFKAAANEVKKDFELKTLLSEKNCQIINELNSCESVCIHIRLGDYLQEPWNSMSRVCGDEYYREAIRIIKERVKNPVFYVFSNRPKDFDYIKENFSFDEDVKYMNLGNTDYEDLQLMRSCKHQISSNSTYSWWAQYLNSNPNKIVVAPCMHNKHNKWDLSCLFMDSWTLVGPEFLNLEGMTCTENVNSISPKIPWERVLKAYKKQIQDN